MNWLTEWAPGAAIIGATILAVGALRAALHKIGHQERWRFLDTLANSISNVLFLVGLRLFADFAPLPPKAVAWLDHGIYILGILILIGLLRRGALVTFDWLVNRSPQSNRLQQGFTPLIRNVISAFIFTMGGIMVLKHLNYDVMSLLAALGVGSLAVGLAAKETLTNMISGFTLIIDRNLKPGDRVHLNGSSGVVEEIGLRSTSIKTSDGNLLIVPNADLVNNKILNLSLPGPEASCSATLRIGLETDFDLVKRICKENILALPDLRQPPSFWIHLSSLSEGHQTIQLGFWIKDGSNTAEALSSFHQKLLPELQRHSIRLLGTPFVHRVNP